LNTVLRDSLTATETSDAAAELLPMLAELGESYVLAAEQVADLAAELLAVDIDLRRARAEVGEQDHRPNARELLADALLGRLGCLRPYVPGIVSEAALRASECLCDPYPPQED